MAMKGYTHNHVYDRLGEYELLRSYLEAKLWMALDEYEKAMNMFCLDPDGWAKSRFTYVQNKVAVTRELLKHAQNPEWTLRRWQKHLEALAKNTTPTDDAEPATTFGEQSQ